MILIVDMNSRKNSFGFDEFVQPIISAVVNLEKCEARHYSELSRVDLEKYDKIILSGTALKDNAFMDDLAKFEWIKKIDKPVLGICAGMHVIGAVFGSHLRECQEIGMRELRTLGENELVSGNFRAYELHNYVTELPGGFEVLAESENCIQCIKSIKKKIYGVLFHPEVRNIGILEVFSKNIL